jgi:hypothetical protein
VISESPRPNAAGSVISARFSSQVSYTERIPPISVLGTNNLTEKEAVRTFIAMTLALQHLCYLAPCSEVHFIAFVTALVLLLSQPKS